MMETADLWPRDDRSRCHDWPRQRRVFVQGQVGARLVIVGDVRRQDATQSRLAQDDDVVEAFSAEGSDHAFGAGVLPGRPAGRDHIGDVHAIECAAQLGERSVPVVNQETGRRFLWKRFSELLGGPGGGGMRGDGDVREAPTIMGEDDEYKEQSVRHRWYDEEVGGHDVGHVIRQEGPPRL